MYQLPCLLIAMILFALPAQAGPASERIFSTAALDLLKVNQQVIYSHTRKSNDSKNVDQIANGEIRIRIRTGTSQTQEAVVTKSTGENLRPVGVWPVSIGNPVLPIFLESVLRAMAQTTGGSAFYIRNRIKDALRTDDKIMPVTLEVGGIEIQAQQIVFTPFVGDKNRSRMGDFKDLTLTFVVSEQIPGDIVRFTASTPSGINGATYHEEINFSDVIMVEE